jgi:hypothetical protein
VPVHEKLTAAGRPRKEPPADAAEVIRHATAHGASKDGVAMALACSRDVLVRWLDERPDLKQAFDEGRERERASLHNVLYEAAMNGAIVPAMFLLKARHGYQEGQQEAQANRVSVTFNIPGALPLDKYMVVENEPGTERLPISPAKRT